MSTPQHPITPAEVRGRAECMCYSGGACTAYAPGHAVHLLQARLASSTPSEWIDGIVEETDPGAGTVRLRTVTDGTPIAVWNGAGAAVHLGAGAPIAFHGRYHVLAVGDAWFNVRRIA